MLSAAENVQWLLNTGTPADLDVVRVMLSRVGRVHGPALLEALVESYGLRVDVLAQVIGDVWSDAEYPDRALPHDTWREYFSIAGYTVDGKRQDRPTDPIRLYRGSVPERRADWSWTDNRQIAERYASGDFYHRLPGQVWAADVAPWRLLARNTGRSEDEYVVETEGLDINPV